MVRKNVASSRMKSVGWQDGIMEIEFPDGAIVQYQNVTNSEYTNFINSPSLGSALSAFDKKHIYHKINPIQ